MRTSRIWLMAIPMMVLFTTVTVSASAQDQTAKPNRHDQLKIAAQGICPVMGQPLGSMGAPIKVRIGEEELFLCCEACRTKQVSREHWATIHTNFAQAQAICPVMKKPLPKNPQWTVVNGQIFYTCCPPCIDKIKADPETYFAKLDDLYAVHVSGPQGHDAIKMAVQKICPVMGKPLGSMGSPIEVRIGEEELFLCCEACRTKQVSREHWATIHANFATAQAICPVMKKPLPKNPQWTVVNGQIFYTCCPPCIDKIKADPATFTRQLDQLYSQSLNSKPATGVGFSK